MARTFSGDVKQMRQLIKAALSQNGVAVIDIISPCVPFNNRDEALQSYSWGREHEAPIQDITHFQSREEIQLEILKKALIVSPAPGWILFGVKEDRQGL